MPQLKALARTLGPKGLMPNVKSGTLVKPAELLDTVKISKQGQIEFRVNEHSDIMVKIGLKEFDTENLVQNFDSVAKALVNKKPEAVKGEYTYLLVNYINLGKYFIRGYIKSSMGPSIKVDLAEYQRLASD